MAKLTESSYEIARPTGVCAATGEAIEPGRPLVAVLVEQEGQEGLRRLDFAAAKWDEGARPALPLRVFGSWRGVMPSGDSDRKPFIDDDSLADLLEQLEGAQQESRLSFRYVLALMLVRKRLFKFEGTVRGEDGRQVMKLRRAAPVGAPQSEVIEVVDPGMDDAAIAAAIEQLGGVMAGD